MSTAEQQAEIEAATKKAWDAGDYEAAATALLTGYGREIMGFLVARTGNQGDAGDAFSGFCEAMWKGLPSFQWRSSARTWAYTIARHTSDRQQNSPGKRRQHNIPLSNVGPLSQLVERVRTQTQAFLRTEVKDRFRLLRDQMVPEDRELLVLRIDKKMSWRDVALVMNSEGADADDAALTKEEARLRKRLQAAKDKLKTMAKAEGLL